MECKGLYRIITRSTGNVRIMNGNRYLKFVFGEYSLVTQGNLKYKIEKIITPTKAEIVLYYKE